MKSKGGTDAEPRNLGSRVRKSPAGFEVPTGPMFGAGPHAAEQSGVELTKWVEQSQLESGKGQPTRTTP
jgi:hypothetical protein